MKTAAVFLIFGLMIAPVQALALEIKTEGFREVIVSDASGVKSKKLEPLTRALPGQELIYVLTYKNTNSVTAENVVIANPLPKEVVYVANSATTQNVIHDVSVDGGKNYAALAQLKVRNSQGVLREANASDVTHLRWKIKSLPVASSGSVMFKAVLK